MKTKEEKRLAQNKAVREWNSRNPEKVKSAKQQWQKANPEKANLINQQWRKKNPARWILTRARGNAKRKNLKFNLTIEDISPLPEKCPVLGIKLRQAQTPQDPNGWSIDRVNNKKGYVKGNIAIISLRANKLKSDGSLKEFKALINWLEKQ